MNFFEKQSNLNYENYFNDRKKSKVETLAKLYLESDSAEISEATIAELCDWFWGEFQSTPLNLQFS